jgi:hypothetical protein
VSILVPQADGSSVKCILAAKVGRKDRGSGKHLVNALLKIIARKKTVNGQPTEIYKASKGSCAGDVVPVFTQGGTAAIQIDGATVLSGIAK